MPNTKPNVILIITDDQGYGEMGEGVALPIARARLLVGDRMHTAAVTAEDEAAVFRLELEAGPTLLHTWFDNEKNQPICGAYYVGVERQ